MEKQLQKTPSHTTNIIYTQKNDPTHTYIK